MANGGLSKRVRRWRRKRLEQPPSAWSSRMSALGVTLLLVGAVLIVVYVARLH